MSRRKRYSAEFKREALGRANAMAAVIRASLKEPEQPGGGHSV
jgi:hypothetical protein